MKKLILPQPKSCGIFLTYRCTAICQHCLYASSPKWTPDFLSLDKLDFILHKLSLWIKPKDFISFNAGIHFSGGEPFLNFELLLESVKLAKNYKFSPVLVETNCFWCTNKEFTKEKLTKLKQAGLDCILISVNPFVIEFVNFKNIKLAVETATEIFSEDRVIIY